MKITGRLWLLRKLFPDLSSSGPHCSSNWETGFFSFLDRRAVSPVSAGPCSTALHLSSICLCAHFNFHWAFPTEHGISGRIFAVGPQMHILALCTTEFH